jgi:hypothetical protein
VSISCILRTERAKTCSPLSRVISDYTVFKLAVVFQDYRINTTGDLIARTPWNSGHEIVALQGDQLWLFSLIWAVARPVRGKPSHLLRQRLFISMAQWSQTPVLVAWVALFVCRKARPILIQYFCVIFSVFKRVVILPWNRSRQLTLLSSTVHRHSDFIWRRTSSETALLNNLRSNRTKWLLAEAVGLAAEWRVRL